MRLKAKAYYLAVAAIITVTLIYSIYSEEPYSLGFIKLISDLIVDGVESTGYLGVLFLMTLESACMPIPSEVIMPFAGYIVYSGKMDLVLVTMAGTLGNLIGSLIAYFFGLMVGRRFIVKYGKYFLIGERELEVAENWFKKYGDVSILIGRVTPVIRTIISLPAGLGRMDLRRFTAYTFIGSIPWNLALTMLGVWLGSNWSLVELFFSKLDLSAATAAIIFILHLLYFKERI